MSIEDMTFGIDNDITETFEQYIAPGLTWHLYPPIVIIEPADLDTSMDVMARSDCHAWSDDVAARILAEAGRYGLQRVTRDVPSWSPTWPSHNSFGLWSWRNGSKFWS